MIELAIAVLALLIWIGMLVVRGGFWLARERDTCDLPPEPTDWPDVVAVVPARDEADVIARAIGSLAAQDYPGRFGIILVDDSSSDGTADVARQAARDAGGHPLEIVTGQPLPSGWTGKLWAVSQGVAAAGGGPHYLWLTDADIAHAPDTLRSLVARAEAGGLVLTSLMAKLRCDTFAERALIPAFVFFFQMLYPFARVNRPGRMAAAAGGCMLARRDALERAGGIAAIRGALIDDCTFGALMKREGPIWLGLTDRSRSIRPYDGWGEIAAMISRSAYAQLGYSPWALLGTLIGMALVYLAPPVLAFAGGYPLIWGMALAAWVLMTIAFQPMLRFYHRSPLWGIALPLIAAFYAGCTFLSAWQHWRGRGGMWKGRAQAARAGG
ncbi:glycosyltransferase [Stakelama sediminis]|uniref:glycosyltransferase n=1 Tax=Stakelama sediminis TaxID=463200 RepID=UPI001FE5F751|nr:glycosyltransferase [Stakelama sediminis]